MLSTPILQKKDLNLSGIGKGIKNNLFKHIIVLTGAGISVSAGIPDFRSPGSGLYYQLSKYNLNSPSDIFNISYFKQNPKPFNVLSKELFPGTFSPTPTHCFIKLLEDKGVLLRNYTQNIDTLERIAGISHNKLVESHGSFNTTHCIDCRMEFPLSFVKEIIMKDGIPHCTECSGLVKPDIVFFGENLPERFFDLSKKDFKECDLLIVMGTSLVVQPFANLINLVNDSCVRLLINKEEVGIAKDNQSIIDKLMGMSGGFKFNSKDNYRDVKWIGDTDIGVKELAMYIGWETELQDIVESLPQQNPIKQETRSNNYIKIILNWIFPQNKRSSSKLSFQLSAPPIKKRKINNNSVKSIFDDEGNDEDNKNNFKQEKIISISSDKGIISKTPVSNKKTLIIPLPKDINTGKIGIRKKQDHLILARIARGEDVTMDDVEEPIKDNFDGDIIKPTVDDIDPNLPLLLRNRRLELEKIEDEDERFRADVDGRPEACTISDYERVPISSFGEALLRGMDWKPGMKIGMNDRGLVKPIEFIPRPRGLGLGAHSSKQKEKRKNKNQKEKPNLILAPNSDGKVRSYRNLDEKLVPDDYKKKEYSIGTHISIINGIHEGISGQIEKTLENDKFIVRFTSGEKEIISMEDMMILHNKNQQNKIKEEKYKISQKNNNKHNNSNNNNNNNNNNSTNISSRKIEKNSWMHTGIMVRIISKKFKSGKYYCKRVQIIDVISKKECTVTVDGKVFDIKENMIETALPKQGGTIMILNKKNYERIGILQSRNSKKNKVVVQHEDDSSFGTYKFEDVAQYIETGY